MLSSRYYCCYDGQDTALFNKIDSYFKDVALALGGSEYQIPALINKDTLEKCGYFVSFPHQITSVAILNKEIASESSQNYFENTELFLTPAACLHFYPMLEEKQLKETILTTKARVYRYEDDSFDGETRLWDFTVRELVFVGEEEYVLEKLEYMKKTALEYARSVGLNAQLVPATDNFYPSRVNALKKRIQRVNLRKFELRIPIHGNEIALASFNYHGNHFSFPFKFDKQGKVVSGCVGFGLERWLSALKQQGEQNESYTNQ